ncbi:YobA family protein [Halobacillus sp. A1]|uniref:DUF3221 domain-containing protein n=1 Tax=Halobacillus sp. A1 TaxID=2880262 RepID=UPI0020A6C3D6|nr:DUF3221 domain-containing protein [Halobacillus sp. A1]MCP3032922.1 YobA family protein [Halobacillus sp. A1]
MKNVTAGLFTVLFLLGGCSSDEEQEDLGKPEIEGYVTNQEDDRILVTDPEPEDANGNGEDDYYDALWGSDAPDDVEIGQYVEVWVKEGVETSYPGQADIKEVEVQSTEAPEGADLSEDEVIRRALEEVEQDVRIIESVAFDVGEDLWRVSVITPGRDGSSYELDVEDD